jgi:hypothetical protein
MSDFTRFVRSIKRKFFTVCINDSNVRAFLYGAGPLPNSNLSCN